jgi:hypothetical protein
VRGEEALAPEDCAGEIWERREIVELQFRQEAFADEGIDVEEGEIIRYRGASLLWRGFVLYGRVERTVYSRCDETIVSVAVTARTE